MIKLIVLLVLGWLGYLIFTKISNTSTAKQTNKEKNQAKIMVACQNCGIHTPQTEAIMQNKLYYCCTEHLPK